MASPIHETLVTVLREHPEWLRSLLAAMGRRRLRSTLAVQDSTLRLADPAEVRPDLVFTDAARKHWAIIEVQLEIDHEKRRRWWLATALLCDQHGVMGDLVVVTTRRSVARWAGRIGHAPGPLETRIALEPVVVLLDSASVDTLLDPARPELAFFAACAMKDRHGPVARRVVMRALELSASLPPDLRSEQTRAIYNVLSEPLIAWLRERLMNTQNLPEPPAQRALREELEARAEARGKAEGEARGKAEGEARGKAEALLAFLSARGLVATDTERSYVAACADGAVLDGWIRRAATVRRVAELFE